MPEVQNPKGFDLPGTWSNMFYSVANINVFVATDMFLKFEVNGTPNKPLFLS